MKRVINYIKKIKRLGLVPVLGNSLYNRLNKFLIRFFALFFSGVKIKDIIVFESHNDYDCNSGAFYEYLIRNNVNTRFKMVWLTKNANYKILPENVIEIKLRSLSIKKYYYLSIAKYLLSEETYLESFRKGQISVYLTHGGCTFKNVKGLIVVPQNIDYILTSSEEYAPMMCDNYSIPYPNNRMLYLGFPSNDVFFSSEFENESRKYINTKTFNKNVLWMPTFRKGGGQIRNDSNRNYRYGIPLIQSKADIVELNTFLQNNNILLTIKIHPMQILCNMDELRACSNIAVLDATDVKKYGIDNYRLMCSADAMISDYSSAAYSYLLLDRPLAFVVDDIMDYKTGFTVDNIYEYMPGEKIVTTKDMIQFIENISNGIDNFSADRKKITDFLYKYKDGMSSQRLSEFLNIK